MSDGNAKSDLEHTSERTVRASTKGTGIIARLVAKLTIKVRKYWQKHFSSSMKALKKDGNTKELAVSPALTREETKELITKARESGILIGIKKMQPNGEEGKNQSLHKQEKLAKNEIKYAKWDERRKTFKKVPILGKKCEKQAVKYKRLSIEDNLKNKDDRFIVLCNKSHLAFFNEQLEILDKKRISRKAESELNNIETKDIDKGEEPLISRDINMFPEDLKSGIDYGSCFVKDYTKNYCYQKISKLEYCEIREKLFELKSHGAIVDPNGEVLVAINSDDLDEYKKFAPLDKQIKEYGESGGRDIKSESNQSSLITVEVDEDRFDEFKRTYKGKDYFAIHELSDGKTFAYVRESDTKQLVDDVKKKSTTADLVKEANELAEEKENTIENVPNLDLIEEEQEIAR